MNLYLAVSVSFFVIVISSWLIWRKRRMSLLQRYHIPGPKPNFWTGNLNEFREGRGKCIDKWIEQYGKFVGFYFGAKPHIVAADVDFLKIMQVKEFKNFTNKDFVLPDAGVPHKSITKALDFLRDEEWKAMRSHLSSAFSTGKIKKMSHIMSSAVNIFLKKVKEEDQTFDIMDSFDKLSFDVIAKTAFGVDTDIQNNNTNIFIRSIQAVFDTDTSQLLPALSVCFPEFEPIPTKLRLFIDVLRSMLNLTSLRTVAQTCEKIIESRRKEENPPSDFLQSMIDANLAETETMTDDSKDIITEPYKMSNEEIIGNVVAFITAGYETTGITLGYCSYLLAQNPEVQEKARAEVMKNIPLEEEIDYDDLANLQYLDQVISETLRLYSLTLNIVNRVSSEEFKYKDVTIPKGVVVLVPVWHLQTDPAYWSEPEKFIPERFSPENRGNIDPFVYQPFGAGPRICLGMRFANTMMKLTLANLLRNFRLEKDENEVRIDKSVHYSYQCIAMPSLKYVIYIYETI